MSTSDQQGQDQQGHRRSLRPRHRGLRRDQQRDPQAQAPAAGSTSSVTAPLPTRVVTADPAPGTTQTVKAAAPAGPPPQQRQRIVKHVEVADLTKFADGVIVDVYTESDTRYSIVISQVARRLGSYRGAEAVTGVVVNAQKRSSGGFADETLAEQFFRVGGVFRYDPQGIGLSEDEQATSHTRVTTGVIARITYTYVGVPEA